MEPLLSLSSTMPTDYIGREQAVGPGLGELRDVLAIDLRQGRIARAGQVAVVHWPIRAGVSRLARLSMQNQRRTRNQHPKRMSATISEFRNRGGSENLMSH